MTSSVQLDLKATGPQEIIRIIEDGQGVLNERLPMNPSNLVCPQCGHTKYFRIEAYQWIDWEPDEITMEPNHEPAWGAESPCCCPECNWQGHVQDYIGSGKPSGRR